MTTLANKKHQRDHRVCPVWVAHTFDNPLRVLFHNPRRMFASYVKPGMRALDLGCGLGCNTIGLAKMVGDKGKVYAVDLQAGMLEQLQKRARRVGLSHRIEAVRCNEHDIGLRDENFIDFALAFWMLHETPDAIQTLRNILRVLVPGGILYLVEPGFHVQEGEFGATIDQALAMGYRIVDTPQVSMSRAIVLQKQE